MRHKREKIGMFHAALPRASAIAEAVGLYKYRGVKYAVYTNPNAIGYRSDKPFVFRVGDEEYPKTFGSTGEAHAAAEHGIDAMHGD